MAWTNFVLPWPYRSGTTAPLEIVPPRRRTPAVTLHPGAWSTPQTRRSVRPRPRVVLGPYCVHLSEVYAASLTIDTAAVYVPTAADVNGVTLGETFCVGSYIGQVQSVGPAEPDADAPGQLADVVGEVFVPGANLAQLQCDMDDLDLPPI